MVTFGKTPTYQSGGKFDFAVSDDKRALTVSFSDLQATVDTGKAAAPISTRVFHLVVPLEGDDKKVEIAFALNAGMETTDDATATLVFSVNGQTTVSDFPKKSEQGFVHQLNFASDMPADCRLCAFLLAGRRSDNPDAAAFLNVMSIEAEILPRAK